MNAYEMMECWKKHDKDVLDQMDQETADGVAEHARWWGQMERLSSEDRETVFRDMPDVLKVRLLAYASSAAWRIWARWYMKQEAQSN